MPGYVAISYLLVICAILSVLSFHLLPAVFAALAVYVLTLKLAACFPKNMNRSAHKFALGVVVICVIVGLTSLVAIGSAFIKSSNGLAALLTAVVDTLGSLRKTLPDSYADLLPTTIEDLRQQFLDIMSEHVQKISVVGMEGFKIFAHVLLGMVVGGMAALHLFRKDDNVPPFLGELRCRLRNLTYAFDRVVFAQVKISALNTLLTSLYLLVALPFFGIHLPMATILIILTFVVGMLPVVGNLISNTAIFVISLGVSPVIAVTSLMFLVLIHKAEYFLNAKIVGYEVQATAWELLSAMLLMEAVFGVAGLVAAPVVYAWLKKEVKELGLI